MGNAPPRPAAGVGVGSLLQSWPGVGVAVGEAGVAVGGAGVAVGEAGVAVGAGRIGVAVGVAVEAGALPTC